MTCASWMPCMMNTLWSTLLRPKKGCLRSSISFTVSLALSYFANFNVKSQRCSKNLGQNDTDPTGGAITLFKNGLSSRVNINPKGIISFHVLCNYVLQCSRFQVLTTMLRFKDYNCLLCVSARSPEASNDLKQKFTQFSLDTGILSENIAFFPRNGTRQGPCSCFSLSLKGFITTSIFVF